MSREEFEDDKFFDALTPEEHEEMLERQRRESEIISFTSHPLTINYNIAGFDQIHSIRGNDSLGQWFIFEINVPDGLPPIRRCFFNGREIINGAAPFIVQTRYGDFTARRVGNEISLVGRDFWIKLEDGSQTIVDMFNRLNSTGVRLTPSGSILNQATIAFQQPSFDVPTAAPTIAPTTASPTGLPTEAPSRSPVSSPTELPTGAPSRSPVAAPTDSPTAPGETRGPTTPPTGVPSSLSPTSRAPTTGAPFSLSPSSTPTAAIGGGGGGGSTNIVPILTAAGIIAVAAAITAAIFFRRRERHEHLPQIIPAVENPLFEASGGARRRSTMRRDDREGSMRPRPADPANYSVAAGGDALELDPEAAAENRRILAEQRAKETKKATANFIIERIKDLIGFKKITPENIKVNGIDGMPDDLKELMIKYSFDFNELFNIAQKRYEAEIAVDPEKYAAAMEYEEPVEEGAAAAAPAPAPADLPAAMPYGAPPPPPPRRHESIYGTAKELKVTDEDKDAIKTLIKSILPSTSTIEERVTKGSIFIRSYNKTRNTTPEEQKSLTKQKLQEELEADKEMGSGNIKIDTSIVMGIFDELYDEAKAEYEAQQVVAEHGGIRSADDVDYDAFARDGGAPAPGADEPNPAWYDEAADPRALATTGPGYAATGKMDLREVDNSPPQERSPSIKSTGGDSTYDGFGDDGTLERRTIVGDEAMAAALAAQLAASDAAAEAEGGSQTGSDDEYLAVSGGEESGDEKPEAPETAAEEFAGFEDSPPTSPPSASPTPLERGEEAEALQPPEEGRDHQ